MRTIQGTRGSLRKGYGQLHQPLPATEANLTSAKQIIRALEKELEYLASSNKELEEFAHITAHDLQEPLHVIMGYSQLLRKRYGASLSDEGHDFLTHIIDGTQRMQQLIRDLLGYAKIGGSNAKFESINLTQIVKKVQQNLQLKIEQSNTQIRYNGPVNIKANPMQMLQLLQHLIANAIKYRRPAESPHIFINVSEKERYWFFAVEDNGIGIENEYSERIFQVFQRLHTREKYEGTGIGLAICKKIVEKHQGKIWMKSTSGKGTTFYFTIFKS
ncbi:ATP-binding protein [Fulvivirgaceae bacterium BMA12]|uniref:histidine kinase n=1 Tax=Agaribacillus aureus TaxID=3051825 RepID=A0ABT8L5I9_9BACT|nr:ATP-binding protein [Fulvivirgaceae bacterium BMA12]